jgi:thymidine phosphorylase
MKTLDDSRALARSLVDIGQANGVRPEALITAMSAPLGRAIGNAIEVIESIETLKGRGPGALEDLSVRLAAHMLVLAGIAPDATEGEGRVRAAIASGAGVEKLRAIIQNQGGDPRVIDDYSRLPATPDREEVRAARSGYLAGLEAERLGRAAVALGAGRATVEDRIDPAVGIEVLLEPGTAVRAGDPVLLIHHRDGRGLADSRPLIADAIRITDAPPAAAPVVVEDVRSVR